MKSVIPVLAVCAGISAAFAQSAAPAAKRLEFEVASIKPAESPLQQVSSGGGNVAFMKTTMATRVGMAISGDRMDFRYGSLRDLIRTAYGLKDYQVIGPDWLATPRFDVEAKLPAGATKDDVPAMLQSLLADRFKLTSHRDSKEHDVYALIVAKGGPKLTTPDEAPAAPPEMQKLMDQAKKEMSATMAQKSAADSKGPATTWVMSNGGTSRMNFRSVTLSGLADNLSRYADRPVIDMTGIEGNYSFSLEVDASDMIRKATAGTGISIGGSSETASDPSGNQLFQSLQTYGLKLEKRKAPMETLVVDRIEKTPTEN